MNRILVIEDEEIILKALVKLLERNHFEVTTAMTVEAAIEAQPRSFDLILADLRLPGGEGTAIIPVADPIPVVIMTSHASVRSAVAAMRSGAIDYIAKPFDHDELLIVIERSLMQNRMRAQNISLRQDLQRLVPTENVMHCKGMQPTIEKLFAFDDSQKFLAIHGQPGTGKELLARMLHANSERVDAPFVVVDLPAIEPDQMHTTLLGGDGPTSKENFMPGGLVHAAHNGTLIIRYPNALPQTLQHELAKTLDASGITSESGLRSVNVRTVLISQTSLQHQTQAGELHPMLEELFRSGEVEVPPLDHRQSDILPLANHYLGYFCKHHHRSNLHFSDDAEAALRARRWPGNADELKTLVERAVLKANNDQILPADLGLGSSSDVEAQQELSLDEYFRYFVTRHQASLSETELAAKLGISRKALWERRQKSGLTRD